MNLKNKNLVLTIAIGDYYGSLAEISHSTLKEYAKKINADFLNISEVKISQTTPHWEKFIISDLLKQYERILYLDTDLIVRLDTPNLFDEVPYFDLGMFNEGPYTEDRTIAFQQTCYDYGVSCPEWDGKYYNSGVMVISRAHKDIFKKPEEEKFNFYEQTYINMKIAMTQTPIHSLQYWFNRMSCMDPYIGENRHASYIIHYAGFPQPQNLPSVMYNDLNIWNESHPYYNFKKHIFINVQGGLGDQLSAEPSIRFLINNIYKNDDIRVSTHFPRLFQHLNVPVSEHTKMSYGIDTRPWEVITLPGPETMQWSIVSNLLTHTTDFCSMALLKRTLPDKDKRFQLAVNEKDLKEIEDILPEDVNFDNLVLVHAGRHWESKTFPQQWWQDIIDKIQENGATVCLIGKDSPGDDGEFLENGARGVIDVECRDGMIDTRNLLSLGGLIALISKSKILLSNDSAPIHLAGPFDNYIILIPTCKHPDHILPYRENANKYYKAFALYKKLTIDDFESSPTTMYTVTADKVKGNFYDYLPDVDTVIDCISEILKGENNNV